MQEPVYLVTGATGKTGSAVTTRLLERGESVRAVVHRRDARSAALERLGADVVVADIFDADRLLTAMRGARRAYYCPPWHRHMLASAVAFAAAAREARLEAVVGLTQWLASPAHPSFLTRQHWLADNVLSMIPETVHVAIAPGYFADSYLMADVLRFAAHLGVFPWPYGDSKNAPPANEDIARVAVAVLLDPQAHAGRAYRPTGPELLSGADMAAILTRVFGHHVTPLPMPMWMFVRAMSVSGFSAFQQLDAREYVREHRRGAFAFNAPTDHVIALTGRPAETFETTARRYAALPQLAPTFANRARTAALFAAIGMRASTDLEAYERRADLPTPPSPHFVVDDERWLIARDPEWANLPAVQRLDLRETDDDVRARSLPEAAVR